MADTSTEAKTDENRPATANGSDPPPPAGPASGERPKETPEKAGTEAAVSPQDNGGEAGQKAETGTPRAAQAKRPAEPSDELPQVKGTISLPPERPLESADPVLLNDRYDVHPAKPLHDLDSPSARAFEAADRLEPTRTVFALVCIPGMPTRSEAIDQIVGQDVPGILDLLDVGSIDWPLLGRRCQILILQRPLGGRVSVITTMELSSHRKADIIRLIVGGVVTGLQQLSFRSFGHGAIRHDNVYFLDSERETVVLGEFFSSPAGFDQPTVFETIERGMATKAGRGKVTKTDDIYALGVMMVFLILGRNPVKDLDVHQLITSKISLSSFITLAGKSQISMAYLDALRGLLRDDWEERWDLEELEQWLGGQRVATLSSLKAPKAPRPLIFGGEEHYIGRTLAHSMSRKPDGALKLIKEHTLDQWLARGLEEKELAASVELVIEEFGAAPGDKTIANDILLTKVLMLMDLDAPIRYKNLSFFPNGFGPMLAVEFLRKGDTRIHVEAVVRGIPGIWFALQDQGTPGSGHQSEDRTFSWVRNFLRIATPGFGLERCLYELNKGIPCLSPIIANEYVDDLALLLPALDKAENRVETKASPIDRHIAAYIATHDSLDVDKYLDEIAASDEATSILGSLHLLARLQKKYGPDSLYGVTKWIGGLIGPAVSLYKSRLTRQAIENEMPRLVRRGSLPDILELLDNAEKKILDANEHKAAIEEFQDTEIEITEIELELAPGSRVAEDKGKKATAITSVLIMSLVISLMLI